ncbi:hypothetical protein BLAT2472_220002 [Burkholderia latens]|uniref:PAAR domain-containing protein n=1 Tax=Burkholderia latens TaxID=488446 RepID=UPI000A5DA834
MKGRLVARSGDKVSCPIHGDNEIVEGSGRTKDGTTPLSHDGDHTPCGAVLLASSAGTQM